MSLAVLVDSMQSFDLEQLDNGIGNRRLYVYLLIRRGRIVYVGRTNLLELRLRNHRIGSKTTCKKKFDKVLYLHVEAWIAKALENALIRRLGTQLRSNGSPSMDATVLRMFGVVA